MDVGQHAGGIAVIGIAAVERGEDRDEVGLLLLGDAALMGEFMGHRGGEEPLGKIHVDIGLSGKGAEEASEVDEAHESGEEHALRGQLRAVQAGIGPHRLPEDLWRAGQHLSPVTAAEAVGVSRNLGGVVVQAVGKPTGDKSQVVDSDLRLFQAAAGDEIVPVVVDAPEQTEESVDPEPQGGKTDKEAVQAL